MDINKFLSKLFGNKSTRDMKLIQPLVETVKKAYPEIQALSNDALRAKTQEVKKYVQSSADDLKAKIAELKAKVEEMPIEDRSSLFSQIDKLEKDVLERYEQALNEVMPVLHREVHGRTFCHSGNRGRDGQGFRPRVGGKVRFRGH